MNGWSDTERAAIDAALSAGRVQRVASCPFWGGVRFEALPNEGEELTGEAEGRPVKLAGFTFARTYWKEIDRLVARGEIA